MGNFGALRFGSIDFPRPVNPVAALPHPKDSIG